MLEYLMVPGFKVPGSKFRVVVYRFVTGFWVLGSGFWVLEIDFNCQKLILLTIFRILIIVVSYRMTAITYSADIIQNSKLLLTSAYLLPLNLIVFFTFSSWFTYARLSGSSLMAFCQSSSAFSYSCRRILSEAR